MNQEYFLIILNIHFESDLKGCLAVLRIIFCSKKFHIRSNNCHVKYVYLRNLTFHYVIKSNQSMAVQLSIFQPTLKSSCTNFTFADYRPTGSAENGPF